mmetsp:Transcript_43361/g.100456  ORF Transcript_43361/g.100456 Transcript_43361/m.100456 type:complete len:257 (-) Transcript_43361:107-877(-)
MSCFLRRSLSSCSACTFCARAALSRLRASTCFSRAFKCIFLRWRDSCALSLFFNSRLCFFSRRCSSGVSVVGSREKSPSGSSSGRISRPSSVGCPPAESSSLSSSSLACAAAAAAAAASFSLSFSSRFCWAAEVRDCFTGGVGWGDPCSVDALRLRPDPDFWPARGAGGEGSRAAAHWESPPFALEALGGVEGCEISSSWSLGAWVLDGSSCSSESVVCEEAGADSAAGLRAAATWAEYPREGGAVASGRIASVSE